ncbi:hypothetical protein PVAP13_3KG226859 [Panicum virgatum]|uniref:Uncharacterized protein n=1 Tax=Panicum virgatum TaxID=38727 RepID=A0A8T0V4T1_PANVG|nr:hypothetical protein PVAP13_3KG226859 [Panicum virgatum]
MFDLVYWVVQSKAAVRAGARGRRTAAPLEAARPHARTSPACRPGEGRARRARRARGLLRPRCRAGDARRRVHGVPEELREAAAGLLCATERCGGLSELQEVRGFLAAKFSSGFISVASELRSGCGVNPKVSHEPVIRVRRLMAWHETTAELARFERRRSHSRSWLMEWWPGGRSSGEGWPRAATREGNAAAWPEASGRWSRNADPCLAGDAIPRPPATSSRGRLLLDRRPGFRPMTWHDER